MRRTTSGFLTPLAIFSCFGLAACASLTGGNAKTEMLIANHTSGPIMVNYVQHEDNGDPTTIGFDQQVQPDGTIRYSGRAGDKVTVYADSEPPLTLVFARRSQVVKVSESSGGVSIDVKQGYTDPNRR